MTQQNSATGTVIVRRSAGHYRDALRAYNIMLDGRRVGRLKAGREISLVVTEGDHKLEARLDWNGSQPISFWLDAHARKVFKVEPSGSAADLVSQIFGTRSALELVEEGE